MAIVTKVDPIDRDIELFFAEGLSPEARSKMLADYARDVLAEADAVNMQATGSVPPHETIVDGSRGASIDTVKPDGTIVFEFDLIEDLFVWIGEQLVQHSPTKTGRYAASHSFTADGVVIEAGAPVPQASEYVFVNTQPYARKIERGLSPQAPDGVYEGVAALARQRFGNIASIKFGFRTPLFGAVHEWAQTTKLRHRRRKMNARDRSEWLRRQPAIIINVR